VSDTPRAAAARVVIVRADPAGAALAYLVARRSIEVTLVERQTDFAREFRGEALMPSGIDAFAQMGLTGQFDGLPQARVEAERAPRGVGAPAPAAGAARGPLR